MARIKNDAGSLGSIGMFADVFVSNEKRKSDRAKKYKDAERLTRKATEIFKRITDMGCVIQITGEHVYVLAPDSEGVCKLPDGVKARMVGEIVISKTDVLF